MYTTLIVNHDQKIRNELKSIDTWDENGFIILGAEGSGIAALEKALILNPDIILLNLWVPYAGGKLFIKEIRDKGLYSKIIILNDISTNPDLVNAFKSFGNCYMLLEGSIFQDSLKSTLSLAAKDIERERKNRKDPLLKHLNKNLSVNAESEIYLKEIFNGVSNDRLFDIKNEIELDIRENGFYIVILEFDMESAENQEDKNKIHIKIKKDILEFFCKYSGGEVFSLNDQQICIILNDYLMSKAIKNNMMIDLFDAVRDFFKKSNNKQPKFYISDLIIGTGNITKGFEQIQELLKYRFFTENTDVITWKYIHNNKRKINTEDLDQMVLNIEFAILEGDKADLADNISKLFVKEIKAAMDFDAFQYVVGKLEEIFKSLYKQLNMDGIAAIKFFNDGNNPTTIEQFSENIKVETIELLKQINHSHITNPIISQAIKYIRKNYNKDLTLKVVSEELSVSKYYLSHLFKQETGENFIDFVTKVRIERAKSMIIHKNMKIFEIAEASGFEDSKYFSQVFKKLTGSTPQDYKKKISL